VMIYVLIVLLAILPFFWLLTFISKRLNCMGAAEVANAIENHIQGTEGPWDWDDFTSVPIANDDLDKIRLRCLELETSLPEEKTTEMRQIVERLRGARD
jgi:hypothetical protein